MSKKVMRLSSLLLTFLVRFAPSIRCIPFEATYENDGLDQNVDGESPLYDNFDTSPLSSIDLTPDLMFADANDQCSTLNIAPNRKARARDAVCSPEEPLPPSDLAIPTLDSSFDTEGLCPFDLNLRLSVLVCGKPVTLEGLTPDAVSTVEEASLCKFIKAPKGILTFHPRSASFFSDLLNRYII